MVVSSERLFPTNGSIALSLDNSTHTIDGIDYSTKSYNNAGLLGPTLRLEKGETVTINVKNNLSEDTTTHWHGLHVSPENDGGPYTVIKPGATWSPRFEVRNPAGTSWYHPHLHANTRRQVVEGLSGMILISDPEEKNLGLPSRYGVDDIPLVIQDKSLNGGQFAYQTANNTLLVNGATNAVVEVPQNVIRLRLLNGSDTSLFRLGFKNNHPFYLIASDGGLLPHSKEIQKITLAPGERAEVLVDFKGIAAGEALVLHHYGQEMRIANGMMGGMTGGMGGNVVGDFGFYNNKEVLKFTVQAADAAGITRIPNTLVAFETIPESESQRRRIFRMDMHTFTINGVPFRHDYINERVNYGATEIWEITNNSMLYHPFHVHGTSFQLLSRSQGTLSEHEKGWKDVVLLQPGERVRFIARFDLFQSNDVPYMYHCHILDHEDQGMMGSFTVQ